MADPLSVAGLVTGVVSLGIQVSDGIIAYIDALKCRKEDIALVKQQNHALRETLKVVKASVSQLERNHADATAAVRGSLDPCEKELKALEALVVNLTACDSSPSTADWIERIKNKGKKLRYPFSRPKLEQLASRLRNANAILQPAIQVLGLSVSQLGTEKLAGLEATSHNISADLLVVRSEISALNSPIQGLSNTLSGFGTRFETVNDTLSGFGTRVERVGDTLSGLDTRAERMEGLLSRLVATQLVISGSLQELTKAEATGRLIGKPALLKDICDAAGPLTESATRATPPRRSDAASQSSSSKMRTYIGGRYTCLCHHRRRLRRRHVVWGSVTLFQETTSEEHLPGCPALQIINSTDRSQTLGLTFTGLRRLLNSAVRLSFEMPRGAGGWSFSPSFSYYPTVDWKTSPAFRVLWLLQDAYFHGEPYLDLWHEKLVPSAVDTMFRLFQAGTANPRAVDTYNRSLVHRTATVIAGVRTSRPESRQNRHLLDLLEYLLLNNSLATYYDLHGKSPLSEIFSLDSYSRVTDPLVLAATSLILRSNTDGNIASLSEPDDVIRGEITDQSGQQVFASEFEVLLHFLASSNDIAEAYGCGPLSLAVLSNDPKQVEYLLQNHPATLAERDLFGHSPLHLAADKPECLHLLVDVADVELLNRPAKGAVDSDFSRGKSVTALEAAIYLSGSRCREGRTNRRCRRCRCAECAVILLQADCAVHIPENLQYMLSFASKRCKQRYIRHMRDRRDRLQQLAVENLSTVEVEQLSLSSGHALDTRAPLAIHLLQNRGVKIPAALAVWSEEGPFAVYQELLEPCDAELFFQRGFHDLDSWVDVGLPERPSSFTEFHELAYLQWRSSHLAMPYQLKTLWDIHIANFTYWAMGNDASGKWKLTMDRRSISSSTGNEPPTSPDEWVAWVHGVNGTVLLSNVTDSCRCRCSPQGCTPATSLLKGFWDPELVRTSHVFSSIQRSRGVVDDASVSIDPWIRKAVNQYIAFLRIYGGDFSIRHHCGALRYWTFTALEIPHTCCQPWDGWNVKRQTQEETTQLEEDHAFDLALLEELLEELEPQLTLVLQDPSQGTAGLVHFWKHIWLRRMGELLDRLAGDKLAEEERRRAEEIGVVWDKPEPPVKTDDSGNPYDKTSLEYWMFELEKIEAECS